MNVNTTKNNNSAREHIRVRHRKWQRYLPWAFLIVLGCNAALILNQLRPSLDDRVEVPKKYESIKLGSKEFANEIITNEEFRKLALDADRAQRERLNARKLARKTFQHPDHASTHYRQRVDDLEFQLRTSFSESEASAKGSVANGIKKEIQRLQQDAPEPAVGF